MAKTKVYYEFKTKRLITKNQEKVYRLCHQDFEGLTVEKAAERLDISAIAVYKTLERLEKIAPQLFPILTKRQTEMWARFYHGGQKCRQIAEELEETERTVIEVLQSVKKGMGFHIVIMANPNEPISLDTLDIDTVIVKKF